MSQENTFFLYTKKLENASIKKNKRTNQRPTVVISDVKRGQIFKAEGNVPSPQITYVYIINP